MPGRFRIRAHAPYPVALWGVIPGEAFVEERSVDPQTGADIIFRRLCGFGIFNDPNDLCLILVLAVVLGAYLLGDPHLGWLGYLLAGPPALFGYALLLTQSRGGLLALVAGVLVFGWERFGWRKTAGLATVLLPTMLLLSGGRQTNLTTSEGTGQARIQLWSEGLDAFRRSPLFGIGVGRYEEECGLVAHNSFVHAYAELGLLGGTMFVGAFYLGFLGLHRVGEQGEAIRDIEMRRLRPYLSAALAASAVGMMSLTRTYTVPTYLVIGLAAAYLSCAEVRASRPPLRLNGALMGRLIVVSLLFVASTYTFVRLFARWG